jgi:molecular chaperone DnaK
MPRVVGIDLGTTNSVVAVIEGGDPVVIPNAEGSRITPSVVAISKTGERLIGQVARRQAVTNPENTISSVKRFMGLKLNDPAAQRTMELVPYTLAAAPNGDVRMLMGNREYAPPEISAMVLQKLKMDAEAYLGEPVVKAVITVPAYFNDSQRQATKDAGRIAGLEVLRIINEPTASALAYGLEKKDQETTIAVYDLGGGTFDISILELSDNVIEVKATSGDTHLGGDDFDQRIIAWLVEEFHKEHTLDLSVDRMALQRLKEAAEKAKTELSSVLRTEINLPFITADVSGPKHLHALLSRSKLEQLTSDLIEQSIVPVKQALADAKLEPGQIDAVILVGGQTRMPAVQEAVQSFFGKEPNKSVNPDEVVALGAAIQAGVLGGEIKDLLLLDVTPLTLGIETLGGVSTKLIERNTTIPTRKSRVFSTASDNQETVEIHVIQGERAEARHNKSLGRFELTGIPQAPRGVSQIEVMFDIDSNGITHVSATDKTTGKEQRITITASSGLTKEEIGRMIEEAEEQADEDRQRIEHIAAQNEGDNAIYSAQKNLQKAGDRVDEETKQEVLQKIADLKSILDGTDADLIRQKTHELTNSLQAVYRVLYNTNQQEEQDSPNTSSSTSGEQPGHNNEG